MFTGIIEEIGEVAEVKPSPKAIRLRVRVRRCAKTLKLGDSLAVNGCCLTVVELKPWAKGRLVTFDLLRETWEKTNLKAVRPGSVVNLERPLRADGRIDGHFVTGHIDGVGQIRRWERAGQDWVLEVKTPAELMRYLVYKGSIAIDGISLTVAKVARDRFTVWIIPHTYEVTALHERRVGDEVNLETDILAKYLQKSLERGGRFEGLVKPSKGR